jgi:hypothetical protein
MNQSARRLKLLLEAFSFLLVILRSVYKVLVVSHFSVVMVATDIFQFVCSVVNLCHFRDQVTVAHNVRIMLSLSC